MKMTPTDFDTLKSLLSPVIQSAINGEWVADYNESNRGQIRFVWDVLRISKGGMRFVCDTCYAYLNDDHITTALRAAVKSLGLDITSLKP